MIGKYLEISTAHITRKDDEIIMEDIHNPHGKLIGQFTEYGYWIWVPHDDLDMHTEEYREIGLSEALLGCLAEARKNGCYYLRLDCDAEVIDTLPKFEW